MVWRTLADLRQQLSDKHHPLVAEVWQLMKDRPPDGGVRLYALWRGIEVRRSRGRRTSALYRLRLLILKRMENWEKYTLSAAATYHPLEN